MHPNLQSIEIYDVQLNFGSGSGYLEFGQAAGDPTWDLLVAAEILFRNGASWGRGTRPAYDPGTMMAAIPCYAPYFKKGGSRGYITPLGGGFTATGAPFAGNNAYIYTENYGPITGTGIVSEMNGDYGLLTVSGWSGGAIGAPGPHGTGTALSVGHASVGTAVVQLAPLQAGES